MAVRDLLWGCPVCRTAGAIRKQGRREQCTGCGARFRRDARATIEVVSRAGRDVRPAGEWLRMLGPPLPPPPDASGRILGPESVRVKKTTGQNPFYYGTGFMGWVETYGRTVAGTLELHTNGLHFRATSGAAEIWTLDQLTGIQPASSSLQVGFRGHMASVKFVEGSVRLWTRAISDLLHEHYRRQGLRVLQLQPHVRTCAAVTTAS